MEPYNNPKHPRGGGENGVGEVTQSVKTHGRRGKVKPEKAYLCDFFKSSREVAESFVKILVAGKMQICQTNFKNVHGRW